MNLPCWWVGGWLGKGNFHHHLVYQLVNFIMLCKCHCTVGKYGGSICEFQHVVQSFRNEFELVPTCFKIISPCYASANALWGNIWGQLIVNFTCMCVELLKDYKILVLSHLLDLLVLFCLHQRLGRVKCISGPYQIINEAVLV